MDPLQVLCASDLSEVDDGEDLYKTTEIKKTNGGEVEVKKEQVESMQSCSAGSIAEIYQQPKRRKLNKLIKQDVKKTRTLEERLAKFSTADLTEQKKKSGESKGENEKERDEEKRISQLEWQQKKMKEIANTAKNTSKTVHTRSEKRRVALTKLVKVDTLVDVNTTKKEIMKKTVFDKMEATYENNTPLRILHDCMTYGIKAKVWIRRYKGVRGIITGFIVAFDLHMNLAMIDVDEVFTLETWMIGKPLPKSKNKKKKDRPAVLLRDDDVYMEVPSTYGIKPSAETVKVLDSKPILSEIKSEKKPTSTSDYLKKLAQSLKSSSRPVVKYEPDVASEEHTEMNTLEERQTSAIEPELMCILNKVKQNSAKAPVEFPTRKQKLSDVPTTYASPSLILYRPSDEKGRVSPQPTDYMHSQQDDNQLSSTKALETYTAVPPPPPLPPGTPPKCPALPPETPPKLPLPPPPPSTSQSHLNRRLTSPLSSLRSKDLLALTLTPGESVLSPTLTPPVPLNNYAHFGNIVKANATHKSNITEEEALLNKQIATPKATTHSEDNDPVSASVVATSSNDKYVVVSDDKHKKSSNTSTHKHKNKRTSKYEILEEHFFTPMPENKTDTRLRSPRTTASPKKARKSKTKTTPVKAKQKVTGASKQPVFDLFDLNDVVADSEGDEEELHIMCINRTRRQALPDAENVYALMSDKSMSQELKKRKEEMLAKEKEKMKLLEELNKCTEPSLGKRSRANTGNISKEKLHVGLGDVTEEAIDKTQYNAESAASPIDNRPKHPQNGQELLPSTDPKTFGSSTKKEIKKTVCGNENIQSIVDADKISTSKDRAKFTKSGVVSRLVSDTVPDCNNTQKNLENAEQADASDINVLLENTTMKSDNFEKHSKAVDVCSIENTSPFEEESTSSRASVTTSRQLRQISSPANEQMEISSVEVDENTRNSDNHVIKTDVVDSSNSRTDDACSDSKNADAETEERYDVREERKGDSKFNDQMAISIDNNAQGVETDNTVVSVSHANQEIYNVDAAVDKLFADMYDDDSDEKMDVDQEDMWNAAVVSSANVSSSLKASNLKSQASASESALGPNQTTGLYSIPENSVTGKNANRSCSFVYHSIAKRLNDLKKRRTVPRIEGKILKSDVKNITPLYETSGMKGELSSTDDESRDGINISRTRDSFDPTLSSAMAFGNALHSVSDETSTKLREEKKSKKKKIKKEKKEKKKKKKKREEKSKSGEVHNETTPANREGDVKQEGRAGELQALSRKERTEKERFDFLAWKEKRRKELSAKERHDDDVTHSRHDKSDTTSRRRHDKYNDESRPKCDSYDIGNRSKHDKHDPEYRSRHSKQDDNTRPERDKYSTERQGDRRSKSSSRSRDRSSARERSRDAKERKQEHIHSAKQQNSRAADIKREKSCSEDEMMQYSLDHRKTDTINIIETNTFIKREIETPPLEEAREDLPLEVHDATSPVVHGCTSPDAHKETPSEVQDYKVSEEHRNMSSGQSTIDASSTDTSSVTGIASMEKCVKGTVTEGEQPGTNRFSKKSKRSIEGKKELENTKSIVQGLIGAGIEDEVACIVDIQDGASRRGEIKVGSGKRSRSLRAEKTQEVESGSGKRGENKKNVEARKENCVIRETPEDESSDIHRSQNKNENDDAMEKRADDGSSVIDDGENTTATAENEKVTGHVHAVENMRNKTGNVQAVECEKKVAADVLTVDSEGKVIEDEQAVGDSDFTGTNCEIEQRSEKLIIVEEDSQDASKMEGGISVETDVRKEKADASVVDNTARESDASDVDNTARESDASDVDDTARKNDAEVIDRKEMSDTKIMVSSGNGAVLVAVTNNNSDEKMLHGNVKIGRTIEVEIGDNNGEMNKEVGIDTLDNMKLDEEEMKITDDVEEGELKDSIKEKMLDQGKKDVEECEIDSMEEGEIDDLEMEKGEKNSLKEVEVALLEDCNVADMEEGEIPDMEEGEIKDDDKGVINQDVEEGEILSSDEEEKPSAAGREANRRSDSRSSSRSRKQDSRRGDDKRSSRHKSSREKGRSGRSKRRDHSKESRSGRAREREDERHRDKRMEEEISQAEVDVEAVMRYEEKWGPYSSDPKVDVVEKMREKVLEMKRQKMLRKLGYRECGDGTLLLSDGETTCGEMYEDAEDHAVVKKEYRERKGVENEGDHSEEFRDDASMNVFQRRNRVKTQRVKRTAAGDVKEIKEKTTIKSDDKNHASMREKSDNVRRTDLKHGQFSEDGFLARRMHRRKKQEEDTERLIKERQQRRDKKFLKQIEPVTFEPDPSKVKKGCIYKKRHANQLFIRGDNIVLVAYEKPDESHRVKCEYEEYRRQKQDRANKNQSSYR